MFDGGEEPQPRQRSEYSEYDEDYDETDDEIDAPR